MEIDYLDKGSYFISTTGGQLVFDYTVSGRLNQLDRERPVTFLVSRNDSDHYHRKIYKMTHPDKYWVLPSSVRDVRAKPHLVRIGIQQIYGNQFMRLVSLPAGSGGLTYLIAMDGCFLLYAPNLIAAAEDDKTAFNQAKAILARLDKRTITAAFMPWCNEQPAVCAALVRWLCDNRRVDHIFPVAVPADLPLLPTALSSDGRAGKTIIHTIEKPGQQWII